MNTLNEEELYQEAIKLLDFYRGNTSSYVSVASIQRRFRIGYTSAAKIVDRLEDEGYVSKYYTGKPRKVLK